MGMIVDSRLLLDTPVLRPEDIPIARPKQTGLVEALLLT